MSDSLRPRGLYSPRDAPGQNTGVGSLSLLQGDLPNPGIEPRSPSLWADSLPAEPQGKPKNTGVGSVSLLQRILPTQELNPGLLHCRWILYQLSRQGSPMKEHTFFIPIPAFPAWKVESVSHSVRLTLCNPIDCSPPGSSVHGILQERILEWVAISFSRECFQPRDQTWVSHIAGRFFTI